MDINETVDKYLNEETLKQKYDKTKKTILSCKTKEQCDVVAKMVKNFEKMEIDDKDSDEWDAFILDTLLTKQYKKVRK